MIKRGLAAAAFFLLTVLPAWASLPEKSQGRVSDFAQVLTEQDQRALVFQAERLEKQTGAQLAVVTVPSLEGLAIEDYALKLFQTWGVGHKGKDDGVLFLAAVRERKVRIEVGYGLEGALNDAKVGRILDEGVLPRWREGKIREGVMSGSFRIMAALLEKPAAPPLPAPSAPSPQPFRQIGWARWAVTLVLGSMAAYGCFCYGAGFRGNWRLVIWGAAFGGIALYILSMFLSVWHLQVFLLPVLAAVVALAGVIFGKKKAANTRVTFSIGVGGGSDSGSGSGGFGGGSSGGGGASR